MRKKLLRWIDKWWSLIKCFYCHPDFFIVFSFKRKRDGISMWSPSAYSGRSDQDLETATFIYDTTRMFLNLIGGYPELKENGDIVLEFRAKAKQYIQDHPKETS